MKLPLLILAFALVLSAHPAAAQTDVWLRVDSGNVFILTPDDPDWVPAQARQQVPLSAYMLTADGAHATIFHATEAFDVPAGAYVFVDDLLPRDRIQLVEALTRIEASQLPRERTPRDDQPRAFGLTYGAPAPAAAPDGAVPYQAERRRAITHYYTTGRFEAALLTLKRAMVRYPVLYEDDAGVELLLTLYARFQLYGFLLDECDRLMASPPEDAVADVIRHWRDVASEALALQPN